MIDLRRVRELEPEESSRAMLFIRNIVVGICIVCFCPGAQAQGGFNNWSEFANWCRSTGGDPLPNPPRCMPRSQPRPDTQPPAEDSSLNKEIEAYSRLIDRIAQGLSNATAFEQEYRTPPESSDEMSERLSQLYDFVADLRTYTAGELDDAIYERHRVEIIPREIIGVEKETAALQYENKRMDSFVYISESAANFLAGYAQDEQRNTLHWFKYVTPKDSLPEAIKYYGDLVGRGLVRPTRLPTLKPYVEPVTAVIPRDHPLYPIAAMPADSSNTNSNINKINDIHRSYSSFLSLKNRINEVHRDYDEKWLRTKEEELYRVQRLRDEALFDGKQLAKQVKVAHENFVVKAVESFVWKTYVTHISIEEARKFYDLNKSWYQLVKASQITDDEVRRNVGAGKAALNIVASRAEGLKQFLDVQKRTLDLLASSERLLLEAPEIAALATPEDTRSFLRKIDEEQSGFFKGLMAQTQDLEPSSTFAQALKKVKVPKSYQNIAKKLGLADDFED